MAYKLLFLFTFCKRVYRCARDNWQLCLVRVNPLITHLQSGKCRQYTSLRMLQSLFQLLKMSSITTPNQTISNIRTGYKFLRENISDFTDLHNVKKRIWKFRVNGIVFGYWNLCKRFPNFINMAALYTAR